MQRGQFLIEVVCSAQLSSHAFLQLLSKWYELRDNARITAELDVACGLARAADDGHYVRPEILTE